MKKILLSIIIVSIGIGLCSCDWNDCYFETPRTLSASVGGTYYFSEGYMTIDGKTVSSRGHIQFNSVSDNRISISMFFEEIGIVLSIDEDIELNGVPFDVEFETESTARMIVNSSEYFEEPLDLSATKVVLTGRLSRNALTRCSPADPWFNSDITMRFSADGKDYIIKINGYIGYGYYW